MYHTSKQAITPTPRCGFCVATGFNIPTNHLMVDTNTGRTICPRLLATVCKFCSITGHTAKHCSERKLQEREQAEAARNEREAKIGAGLLWMTPTKTTAATTTEGTPDQDLPITGSRFGILCEEAEQPDEEPTAIIQRKTTPSSLKSESPPKPDAPRVAWPMALKIADVPQRTSTRDLHEVIAIATKQLSYTRLIEANQRWESGYPAAKEYEKTRWEEVDLDDHEELPDVHDMFRAEERARMLRRTNGIIV